MANEQKIMLGKKTGGYILLSELTIRKFLEKSGISNGDIDKILQWLLDNGGGSGGSGTSVPTSNTTAKFDTAKHMNSEDMTTQELSNYITSLPQGISTQVHLQSMMDIFMGNCTNLWPTMSLYNCTGTLTNNVYIRNKGDVFHFGGRIAITGFTRTGSNPGVQFTLNEKKPPKEFVYYCGMRAESPREVCFFNWYTDGYIRIRTSESYTNASGSTLTLILPSVFICVE